VRDASGHIRPCAAAAIEEIEMSLSASDVFFIVVGLMTVAVFFYVNGYLYRGGWAGAGVTLPEGCYYVIAAAALGIGWYFNLQYMRQYGAEGGWSHWTRMLFVNPASASAGQDLIIANLLLFPMWTIIDGRRRGMKAAWIYFPMSLLTSYAFGIALFLAAQERQLRWLAARSTHGAAQTGVPAGAGPA
jgi:hypothetical protein